MPTHTGRPRSSSQDSAGPPESRPADLEQKAPAEGGEQAGADQLRELADRARERLSEFEKGKQQLGSAQHLHACCMCCALQVAQVLVTLLEACCPPEHRAK